MKIILAIIFFILFCIFMYYALKIAIPIIRHIPPTLIAIWEIIPKTGAQWFDVFKRFIKTFVFALFLSIVIFGGIVALGYLVTYL